MTDTLVVGVDGTADSLAALNSAAQLAQDSRAGLVVLHVRHETSVVATGAGGEAVAVMVEALDQVERRVRENVSAVLAGRPVPWRFEVAAGDPAAELMAAARAQRARTIVVGGRNHGVVGGLLLGSVAQKLVRHSPVSVLVVRRDGETERVEVAPAASS